MERKAEDECKREEDAAGRWHGREGANRETRASATMFPPHPLPSPYTSVSLHYKLEI